jgi:predicted PurR-regulated permease PerM
MTGSEKVKQSAYWFIIIGLVVLALVYFRSLLQPFILAVVVWYLIRGTRNLIARINFRGRHMPHWLNALLSILLTFTVLWLIVQIVSFNINLIINKSPQYNQNLTNLINNLSEITGIGNIDTFIQEQLSRVDVDVQTFATNTLNVVSALLGNVALVLVYVIFLYKSINIAYPCYL